MSGEFDFRFEQRRNYQELDSLLRTFLQSSLEDYADQKLTELRAQREAAQGEVSEAVQAQQGINEAKIAKAAVIEQLKEQIAESEHSLIVANQRKDALTAERIDLARAVVAEAQAPAVAVTTSPAVGQAAGASVSPAPKKSAKGKSQTPAAALVQTSQAGEVTQAVGSPAERTIIQVERELTMAIARISIFEEDKSKQVVALGVAQQELAIIEAQLTEQTNLVQEKQAALDVLNENFSSAEKAADKKAIANVACQAWETPAVKSSRKELEKQFNEYKSCSKYNANYNNISKKLWRGAKFVVATALAAGIAYLAASVAPTVAATINAYVTPSNTQPFVNAAASSWNYAKDYLVNNISSWFKAMPGVLETLNSSSAYIQPIGKIVGSCIADASNMAVSAVQHPAAQTSLASVSNAVQFASTYIQEDGYAGVVAKITKAALAAIGVATSVKLARLPYSLLASSGVDQGRENKLSKNLGKKANSFLAGVVEQKTIELTSQLER